VDPQARTEVLKIIQDSGKWLLQFEAVDGALRTLAGHLSDRDHAYQLAVIRAIRALWLQSGRGCPGPYAGAYSTMLSDLRRFSEDEARPKALREEALEACVRITAKCGPSDFAPLCDEVFSSGKLKTRIPLPTRLVAIEWPDELSGCYGHSYLQRRLSSVWTPRTDTLACVSSTFLVVGGYYTTASELKADALEQLTKVRFLRMSDGKMVEKVLRGVPPKRVAESRVLFASQCWAKDEFEKWLSAFSAPW
jgi:hypothetical protein